MYAIVNAAGISERRVGILEQDVSSVTGIFDTNLLGVYFCMRAASSRMAISRGGKGGAIVNVSSEAGRFGGNRISAYAAAKAGVNALTVGVAKELAVERIRVNAVSPGVIDTAQHQSNDLQQNAALVQSIPMKRMGNATEVAEAVLWLLSDKASYVTGALLSVSGGR